MFAMPPHRLTGLLSAVAFMLLLLAPVLASATTISSPTDHMAGGMMIHGDGSTHDKDDNLDCWQQCLSSCSSHCAPPLPALSFGQAAKAPHVTQPASLYRPLFPSGLHRPPKA